MPQIKLFIVAWLPAITPRAPNNALHVNWLTSVLPAITAEGYFAFIIELSGIFIFIGLKQPSFNGMFLPTNVLNTYNITA